MGGIVVQSEFIKKTQPFICGEGVFRKDAPHCADDPKDLNLGLYNDVSKWRDYIPWHKSDEVQYCEAYVDIYQQSNGLCLDTSLEAQKALQAVIDGFGETAASADAGSSAAPKIPTYYQVYALLAQQQPGVANDHFRRMQPYLVAKAKRIYEGLVELDRLRGIAGPDPTTALAIEQKKVALLQEIRQTCIENNPDALRGLGEECRATIENYKTVKSRQKWIGTTIVAVVVAVAAAAGRIVRGGRSARTLDAAGAELKEGKKKYKWYDPRRWLGALDVFWRSSEGIPPEGVPPGFPPPLPGAPPGGPPAPAPGAPPGAPPAPPPGSAAPPGATAAPGPAPYSPLPDTTLKYVEAMIGQAKDALRLLSEALRAARGPGDADAARLDAALAIADADAPSQLQRLAPIALEPATIELLQAVARRFEEEFFDDLLPRALVEIRQAAALAREGRTNEAQGILDRLLPDVQRLEEARVRLRSLNGKIRDLNSNLWQLTHVPPGDAAERVERGTQGPRSIIHDTATPIGAIAAAIGFFNSDGPSEFAEMVERVLMTYDPTSVNAIVNSVATLNQSEANRRGVTVTASHIADTIPIPVPLQRDLFRVLFEAVHNAIKYSDSSKPQRTVQISASAEEGAVVFRIKDNGVGMSDEEARRLLEGAGGLRLRPDLAPGTGHGIAGTIIPLAAKNGWQVTYDPTPGEGVEVAIRVRTADWSGSHGAPSGPASPASAGTAGDAPAGAPSAPAAPSASGRHSFGGVEVAAGDPWGARRPHGVVEDGDDNAMGAPWGLAPFATDPTAAGLGIFAAPAAQAPAFAR